MELLIHLLEHAFNDTIYLVPFLFVTYVALETLEHKAGDHAAELVRKAGVAGPLVGALLGAVPQCGFSAAGSALYASRAITLGTLFAVFLSTSDEMLPLFIAEQVDPGIMFSIIATKVVIGMIMGFAIDGMLRLRIRDRLKHEKSIVALSEAAHIASDSSAAPDAGACDHHEHAEHHCAQHGTRHECCEHTHHVHEQIEQPFSHHHCHNASCTISEGSNGWKDIFLSALKHTVQVSLIVYLISFALVAVMEIAGEEALATFLATNPGIAIFGSALVGLIPNCGASVIITQLYLDGMLGTGAMISGLLVSAGVGILVLFGENRRVRQNIAILLGLFAIGVAWGLIFEVLGIHFM
ncbi:MAG: putative manganese transporter [Eggerthellaceae bacterium]